MVWCPCHCRTNARRPSRASPATPTVQLTSTATSLIAPGGVPPGLASSPNPRLRGKLRCASTARSAPLTLPLHGYAGSIIVNTASHAFHTLATLPVPKLVGADRPHQLPGTTAARLLGHEAGSASSRYRPLSRRHVPVLSRAPSQRRGPARADSVCAAWLPRSTYSDRALRRVHDTAAR